MKTSNTAERLRQIMKERGLKQVDVLRLAKPYCDNYNVKLTKSALNQYISGGVTDPRSDKLSILSYALNVSEAWLMGYDVPMERTTPIPSIAGDERQSRMGELFEKLSDAEQEEIISLIEWKLSKR